MFNHEELFTAALGLKNSLYVKDIDFKPDIGELHIQIDFRKGGTFFPCPVCQQDGQKVYDTRLWQIIKCNVDEACSRVNYSSIR
jgi:hypothetical protein